MLVQAVKHLGYNPKDVVRDDRLRMLSVKLNIQNEEDLLASLGYGGIAMPGILTKLIELHKDAIRESTPPDISKLLSKMKQSQKGSAKKSSHGILVEGESGFLVRLAHCCKPIPGDPITGFITRGRGVSVHRSDCQNVTNDTNFSRMIEVTWDVGLDKTYTVELEILCNDRNGILAEILAVPTEMKFNIHSVNANPNRGNKTTSVLLGLDVRNAEQVSHLMNRLRQVKDVYSVARAMGTAQV